jgi:hypothetical protein
MEIREKLVGWKQAPASSRPSLRALAREQGTSHELLRHYLAGLEKWKYKEVSRKAESAAERIRTHAKSENRNLTAWEQGQVRAADLRSIRALAASALIDSFEEIKRAATRGPLHWANFKMLQIFAKQGFPEGARELLEKCAKDGPRKRKSFATVVRDTPRHAGESYGTWVRRIWDECQVYGTDCPTVVTEEILERCSRRKPESRKDNLPSIEADDAKSFRSVEGDAGNSAKVEGRRSDAIV